MILNQSRETSQLEHLLMFKMLPSMACLRPLVVMSISMMLLDWEETLSLHWLQIRRKRTAAWVPYLTVSLLGDLLRHDKIIQISWAKIEYPIPLSLVKSSEHSFSITSFLHSFAENPDFIEILHNPNTNMYIIKQDEMKGNIVPVRVIYAKNQRTLDIAFAC